MLSRLLRLGVFTGLVALGVSVPSQAHAGKIIDLGAGVIAGPGGNFLTKPDNTTVTSGGVAFNDTSYPGFSGATVGYGLMLDLRVLGLVGVEVDFIRSVDKGSGDINNSSVEIGQPALHVPVLVKGVIPLGIIRPFAVFGPEFVFPGTSEASGGGFVGGVGAYAENYTMLTGGLGLEIKLPIPIIDLRIPLSLRFSANPSTSSDIADRARYNISPTGLLSRAEYRSEWQYRAFATVGAAFYF